MDNISVYIVAGATILGFIWGIAKVIVKLTKTTKDDEFVAKAGPTIEKVIDGFDGSEKK